MRAVVRGALFLSYLTLCCVPVTAGAAEKTYTWADIDCSRSRIAAWPGLKCQATNVVTTEGNVGAFRRWTAFGYTAEGYTHIFLWEGENAYSYIPTEDTTADFLKWMYGSGGKPSQFSPVFRFHNVDASSFRDGQYPCAGFRRTGHPRRGGYDWVLGGLLCAPQGRTLSNEQFGQFIERVQLR
jgi:hypothetical protein